jgi:GNAT superfamily N-acetyltransferase
MLEMIYPQEEQRFFTNRLLTLSDVELAAHVLSQGFVEDPLCAFMLPFERTRAKTLHTFFRAYGEANIKNQRGYGIGEPLKGVAYWKFPSQAEISISVKSLSVFIPLLFTFYPIGYLRARAILKQIDALHQKHVDEAHFYLDNIGVIPSARGKGVSSKLIRPFLEKADSEKSQRVYRHSYPLECSALRAFRLSVCGGERHRGHRYHRLGNA